MISLDEVHILCEEAGLIDGLHPYTLLMKTMKEINELPIAFVMLSTNSIITDYHSRNINPRRGNTSARPGAKIKLIHPIHEFPNDVFAKCITEPAEGIPLEDVCKISYAACFGRPL